MATESKKKTIIWFDPERGPTHPGLRPSWSQIRIIYQLEDIDEEISDSLNYIMSLDRGYRGAVITSPRYNVIGIKVSEEDREISDRMESTEVWRERTHPVKLNQTLDPKYPLEPMVIFDLPGYLESLARVVESMDGGEESKVSRVAITETARVLRGASKRATRSLKHGNYKEIIQSWLERIMSSEEVQDLSERVLGERGPGRLWISPISDIRSTGIPTMDEEKVASYLAWLLKTAYHAGRGLRSEERKGAISGAGTLVLPRGAVLSPMSESFWSEGEDGGILIGIWGTECEVSGRWCEGTKPKDPSSPRDSVHIVVPMLISRRDENGAVPLSLETKSEGPGGEKYRIFYVLTASVGVIPLLEEEIIKRQKVILLGKWARYVVSKELQERCGVSLKEEEGRGPSPHVVIGSYWGMWYKLKESPYGLVIHEVGGEEDPTKPRTQSFREPTKVEIKSYGESLNMINITPYAGAPYGIENHLPSVRLGIIKQYPKEELREMTMEYYLSEVESGVVPLYQTHLSYDKSEMKLDSTLKIDEKSSGIMTHLISIIYYKSQVEKYRLCYPVPKGTSKAERRTVEMLEREAKEIAEQSWEGGSLMRALLDLYSKCPEEEKEQGRKVVIREMVGVQGEQVRPLGKRVEITLKLGEYKSNNLEETLYLWVQHAVDV